jgi:hypothetical protein
VTPPPTFVPDDPFAGGDESQAGASSSSSSSAASGGDLVGLDGKVSAAEGAARTVVQKLAALGQAWQAVATTTEVTSDNILDNLSGDAIEQLDAAQTAYKNYLAKYVAANDYATAYQKTYGAWWDNWTNGEAYTAVFARLMALPRDIGGLKPNPGLMKEIAKSLDQFGDAAGFQVTLSGSIVTVADVGEKLGYAAGLATGGVTTGAAMLTRVGLTQLVKTVAINWAVDKAATWTLTPAMTYAMSKAVEAGVNPTLLQAGMIAIQFTGLVKTALPKCVGGNCFVAGTRVLVGYGDSGTPITRNIEDVQVGDYVLSRDQYNAGDGIEPHRVTNTFARTSDHIRTLSIRDKNGNVETVQTTDEHPLWVVGKGWTKAGDLQLGDRIGEADGSNDAVVVATSREEHPDGVAVYNFEVEGDHTYFVEDGRGPATTLWAHNYCTKNTFFGRLKGTKATAFPDAPPTSVKLTKVSAAQNDHIWNEFNGTGQFAGQTPKKVEFIKWLATAKRDELMQSPGNFSAELLDQMAITGELPSGMGQFYQIHHKIPREFGGTNDFDNLMIIRQDPYHAALSREIQLLTPGMSAGHTVEVMIPIFQGKIFYDPA